MVRSNELDRSLGPAPPHAKRDDKVARRIAGKACHERTGKHAPARECTIGSILNDNAEQIRGNKCYEPSLTEGDVRYDKAKDEKADNRRNCVRT
jgi:hypothetical protein